MPIFCVQPVAEKICNGCLIQHGSQDQHNVCLLPEAEKVEYCLDKAVKLLDEDEIQKYVVGLPHAIWKVTLVHDKFWRQTLWSRPCWQDKVIENLIDE